MRFFYIIIALFLLTTSSCSNGRIGRSMRIGIDKEWYPIDFGPQQPYVNGYTQNLLSEMSSYSGMNFELIEASWDNLMQGLEEKQYDAVLTSIPPYEYNIGRFAFSSNFLDVGPVLIVPYESKRRTLNRFSGDMIGIITNDPASLILEKHPEVIIRQYPSIPMLLDSLAKGEIQGAVLNQIPAAQYIADLYQGILKISSKPLNDSGLHMVGREEAVEAFDQSLKSLKRKSTIKKLQKKWELSI